MSWRGDLLGRANSVNMENFITGYPGHEFQVRAALKKVLGEEKYEYFFDKVGLGSGQSRRGRWWPRGRVR